MRILFVYQFCTPGGVEAVISGRMQELDGYGVDSFVLFLSGGDGISLFKQFGDRVYVTGELFHIITIIESLHLDFIISIDTPQINQYMYDNKYYKNMTIPKLIYEIHTTYPQYLNHITLDKTMREVCAFFSPSTSQKMLVQALLKMDEIPVVVIPNLLPRLFLSPPSRPKYSAPIILWVGRLDSHKNWMEFLAIAKDINSLDPDVEFWLVGGARSENHEKEKMWATVKKYNLVSRFRWLPSVAYEQMPALYAFTGNSGGCLLSTSKGESFGMVVVEAMACGCPVVAPDISAFKELIQDGVNGCLYRSGNRGMAVERVRCIIDLPTTRLNMIKNAQEFVTKAYHPERVMAGFLSVLEGLQAK